MAGGGSCDAQPCAFFGQSAGAPDPRSQGIVFDTVGARSKREKLRLLTVKCSTFRVGDETSRGRRCWYTLELRRARTTRHRGRLARNLEVQGLCSALASGGLRCTGAGGGSAKAETLVQALHAGGLAVWRSSARYWLPLMVNGPSNWRASNSNRRDPNHLTSPRFACDALLSSGPD